MEVLQPLAGAPATMPGTRTLPDQLEMTDVDVDMDLDLGPIEGVTEMDVTMDKSSRIARSDELASRTSESAVAAEIVANKLHIRGLDDLATGDIKAYCSEHVSYPFEAIEWINDTAANIIYANAQTALDALTNLSSSPAEILRPRTITELRPAKPFSSRSDSHLQLRIALSTDKKQKRAHETSRFYLLHPEHDPREHSRRNRASNQIVRSYRRRRYSAEEDRRRRRNDALDGFDATMYDDDGSPSEPTDGSSPVVHHRRKLDSYRPQRERSASPRRLQDRSDSYHRRRSPPPPAGQKVQPLKSTLELNKGKELLPERKQYSQGKDLFGETMVSEQPQKELFPNKTPTSNHRRTDAMDAADETADLFAGKFLVPFTDGATEGRSLASRISRPTGSATASLSTISAFAATESENYPPNRSTEEGYHIRGTSVNGISIKGGARHIGTVKELFPAKAALGTDLFAERLKGRGGPRMRAEDLFS